jgi:hypothetical protein
MTTDVTIFDEDELDKHLGRPLVGLALDELTRLSTSLLDYAVVLGQRTALMTYEAGRVLFEIRERLKEEGGWVHWLEEQGLARSTVGNVIALYERVPDGELIRGLTIMEAYRKFGVLAPKKGGQKALPKPDDDLASNGDRPSPSLLDCPEEKADEGMEMDEGSQPSDDPERMWEEGNQGTHEEDEGVDDSLEAITIDKAALMKITRDIAKSVTLECLDDMKKKLFASLEITDELTAIAENAFLKALRKEPIEPDARLEVALDKMYSAILEVKTVGLQGSAKETAWLLEKMVLAAQARLQRAG